jgi:KipI family sensor histidine kinase inhibitor
VSVEAAWSTIEHLGERAVLIGTEEPRSLGRALSLVAPADLEIVVGLASVLILGDAPVDRAVVDELVAAARVGAQASRHREHRIEVVLDGADLDEACRRTGLAAPEVARSLEEPSFEVATVGFAPGFGYLTGLGGPLAELERRPTPRSRVPKGSLAVAAGYTALYPEATPGGWWLLGRTSQTLFDQRDANPSLLQPGDTVRLEVVHELGAGIARPRRAALAPPLGVSPVLMTEEAPPGCSVVDDGRRGFSGVGVPRGGAFDSDRAQLVRRLLGDAPGAIELVAGGLVLRALEETVVAGIDLELELDGRVIPSGMPVGIRAGSVVRVVGIVGPRGYLGVRGGPLIHAVLGSMGTDQLSFVGPGLLAPGDTLGATRERSALHGSVDHGAFGSAGELRVLRGPHVERLRAGSTLDGMALVVREPSNRVGLRLEALGDPLLLEPSELASFPVVTGAVQVPPDGRPVILGPDHATLGGYPVVGCVIGADLAKLGRLAPGDQVRFSEVDLDEARRAWFDHEVALAASVGPRVAHLEDG